MLRKHNSTRLFRTHRSYKLDFPATILLIFVLDVALSIEEPETEINLSPRNFNPHPYQHRTVQEQQNRRHQGPVVFPRNEGDDEQHIQNPGNVIVIDGMIQNGRQRIENQRQNGRHPVYNYPYAKVAKKQRYKVMGRFDGDYQNKETNTDVYQALAIHGSKVLTRTPEELKGAQYEDGQINKNYKFSYKVLDHFSGDDFSHRQSINAKTTNGEYRVKLPDGRLQVVSYVADGNGYKADVKYEPDNEIEQQQIIRPPYYDTNGRNVDVQRIPVRELKTIHPQHIIYDNNAKYRKSATNPNLILLEKFGPTVIPVNYIDVGVTPTTPSPFIQGGGGGNTGDAINQGLQRFTTTPVPVIYANPKVQIFTSNARDYLSRAGYVPPTAAPYVLQSTGQNSKIRPEVVNNGDHGLFSPSQEPVSYIEIIPTTASPLYVYTPEIDKGNSNHIPVTTVAPYTLTRDSHYDDNHYSDYQGVQEEYGIFYVNPKTHMQRRLRSRK